MRPTRSPRPAQRAPAGSPDGACDTQCPPLPAAGCSGEGAASAMAQWRRQNEERERVMEQVHPREPTEASSRA